MKRLIIISIALAVTTFAKSQIIINSDSLVFCKWDTMQDKYIPVSSIKDNMIIEIDKDLLTIRIYGNNHEKAKIEKAFITDFREMSPDRQKWLFQGSDIDLKLYTVTLDVPKKQISFISNGKAQGFDRPLEMFYYSISDIKINNDAITKHLEEKGQKKD